MITKTFVMRLRKLSFRIVSWVLLFTSVSIATFITLGYFAASKPVSYLPGMFESDLEPYASGANQIELKRSWCELFVDEYGRVTIKTIEGEVIMSNLTYYSAYEGVNDDWGLDNISVKLTSDSIILIIGEGPLDVLVRILLTIHNDIPKIDVNIKTLYSKNTIVRREALVAAFDVKVSEVYRKNRQVDVVSFDYMPDGVIYINNGNDEPIKGLSLVVHANTVRINGEIPKFRRVGENTIFWFDIPAKHSVSMQVEL